LTGKRDYQRGRVYAWENRVIAPRDPSVVLFSEAQGMVNAIWTEMGLRYPPKVEPLPKQTTNTIASADGLSIFLGDRTPSWCLLHELAHDMTSTDEVSDGHSPQFMGVYLKLLARYLRLDLRDLVRSSVEEGLAVDVEADSALLVHARTSRSKILGVRSSRCTRHHLTSQSARLLKFDPGDF
jgi:hypothetical protein